MKDNTLKRDGVFAISALFGVLAGAVALVAFAYSWLGAALIGLILAIIVAIILWLGWRDAAAAPVATPAVKTSPKPAPKPAAKAAAKPAAKAKAADAKPAVLKKARAGGPDDLKMIKGVGPALEKALHETGVFHFDQVAAWSNMDARWFDENVKGANGRVQRDGWIKQARILAKGGTTEFANKVKKGGVY